MAPSGASALAAAHLMRERHVGDLLVVSSDSDEQEPIGIVTDRDITIEVLGQGLDPAKCASCHGPSGQGDARKAVPWLAGQHFDYLLREMYYTFDHRRPNLTNHRAFLARFTRPDYQGVADYLSVAHEHR